MPGIDRSLSLIAGVRFHGDVIIGRSRRVTGSMISRQNESFAAAEVEVGGQFYVKMEVLQ